LFVLDDIGGELGRVAAADVAHRVDYSCRDGQGVPGVVGPGRLAVELVLQRPFQDVDDLLAGVGVLDQRCGRAEVDARLDDLASEDAEILLLEVGAPESRRLLDPPARGAAAVLGRTYPGLPSVSAE
jgi:hypothetical protein